MKFTMKTIDNNSFRRFIFAALVFFSGTALFAAGKSETAAADGGGIWQNDFNVTNRRKGLYNYIVYAQDRAGNEAVSGPFNVKVNPNAGLPETRVIYPENNMIIRQNINILGVASARYGVAKVMIRLDNGDYIESSGTDYWNKLIDFSGVPDGRHTLSVQAHDSKGVPGPEAKVNFILDTSPPQIEITSHKVGDIITGTTTIRGRVSDANGIQTLEYSEDGIGFKNLRGQRFRNGIDFSISLKSKDFPDGPIIYFIRTVDTTGRAVAQPCLFFVNNSGPELELFTPRQGDSVFETFLLSGSAYAKIGITQVFYEYGKIKQDIEIRQGDPFWSVTLEAGRSKSIKVSAIDKVGNVTSVTRGLEDRRAVKKPVLVIDYPSAEGLKALSPDASIYGHILPGTAPRSVLVDGGREVEAMPSFRIGADQLQAKGRSAQTIRLIPIAQDNTRGTAVRVSFVKQDVFRRANSQVTVTSPKKYAWVSGNVLPLRGSLPGGGTSGGAQLQYRLDPSGGESGWRSINVDASGNFSADVNISGLSEGPVHFEIRNGNALPVYHPFNRAESSLDVQFITPDEKRRLIHGNKTIIGLINHTVPIDNISYSLNGLNFDDVPFDSRYGATWFSYFCDFTSLNLLRGRLVFRITDASGAKLDISPAYTHNPNPPVPQIIVNGPGDNEVITAPFEISGVAFDDVGVKSVHWRFLGPKRESVSSGAAGRVAREAAEAFAANPNVRFNQFSTNQSFSIPVDFTMITDGEYTMEVYAADPYGVKSETISRTIKVSTAPPETRIMAPVITRYNNGAIMMRGFSSDANIVNMVDISMDNGNTWQDVVLSASGSWEIALNTINYTDGIYSALIRTEDKYGIKSFSNAMVNIDNTPPELYLSSPANGEHVGSNLELAGRVSDNIALKSLAFQLISADNPEDTMSFELPPQLIIFENMSFGDFPQGEYIVRIVAKDLADNESVVSRKIVYDADDKGAQIAIFNPLPGEMHTGPVHVVGIVTGSFIPETVQLLINGRKLAEVGVDRYGIFRHEVSAEIMSQEGAYRISAYYTSETGIEISSPRHIVYYSPVGPVLSIDSHMDGDVITKRPWLEGRAWYAFAPLAEGERMTLRQKSEMFIKKIEISYDNGRIFRPASGANEWKFRLEAGQLPAGPQPVLIRAQFANGAEAVRRLLLYVDTTDPQVETISPPENSTHRDNILVYGTADDNFELADVNLSLRPNDKFFYSVPKAIQGLYFDAKTFGATYFDVGLGLSFFNDNVRFQFQYGLTPPDGINDVLVSGGRFTGDVFGIKLLANIFNLPFAFFFGPDWEFYEMNVAVGANFSWFTMGDRDPLYMGAIVGQWDVANINMQFFNPKWKYFRNYALYVAPELWFASSDIEAETIFRMTVGLRVNFF